MNTLLFTLDYELYGNGSGDVFKHIVEPTERLVKCVEKYGAKLTVFFEVVEYWKLKEEWDNGNNMGYSNNPIKAIDEQLQNLYMLGHDIQLHVHPQWVNAKWANGKWNVDLKAWRLGGFITEDNTWTIERLLAEGKSTIEDIIQKVDLNYRCTCLRAGGYNIQPSEEIVMAMKKVGLIADTSIYPGGKETGSLSRYDYTSIPVDTGFWYCSRELENFSNQNTGIMELPIVAFPLLRFSKYMSVDRIKSLLQNRKSAKDAFEAKTSTNNGKSGLLAKIAYFFGTEAQTWDYCLFSKSMHRKFLRKIKNQTHRRIFTLVGHPKSLISCDGLEYLLKKTHKEYMCCTMTKYINDLHG